MKKVDDEKMKKLAYKAEEGEEGEEEMEEEEGEKSLTNDVTEEELIKSLAQLEDVIAEGDTTTRKEILLSKAQGGDLDADEREELFEILGGGQEVEKSLADDVTEGMHSNDTLQKSIDVSDYLHAQHAELVGAVEKMADHVEKSDMRQNEFNLILAKAVHNQGKLVHAMSKSLGVISLQPARAPKAHGVRTLEKSFHGAPPAGERLSKSQVLDVLDAMQEDSMAKGRSGAAECGEDLLLAIGKFEGADQMSKGLHNEMMQFHKARSGGSTH